MTPRKHQKIELSATAPMAAASPRPCPALVAAATRTDKTVMRFCFLKSKGGVKLSIKAPRSSGLLELRAAALPAPGASLRPSLSRPEAGTAGLRGGPAPPAPRTPAPGPAPSWGPRAPAAAGNTPGAAATSSPRRHPPAESFPPAPTARGARAQPEGTDSLCDPPTAAPPETHSPARVSECAEGRVFPQKLCSSPSRQGARAGAPGPVPIPVQRRTVPPSACGQTPDLPAPAAGPARPPTPQPRPRTDQRRWPAELLPGAQGPAGTRCRVHTPVLRVLRFNSGKAVP